MSTDNATDSDTAADSAAADRQAAPGAVSALNESHPVSYGRRLRDLAELHGDARAFVFAPVDGPDIDVSWNELEARSNQVARLLAERGVGYDDLIVVGLKNSTEHFFASFAIWKLGACVLPLRFDLPAWERERLLEVAAPRLVIAEWTDTDQAIVTLDQIRATTDRPSGPLPDVTPPRQSAIASSGSTGRPKIIVAPIPGEIDPATEDRMTGVTTSCQLIPAPLYHTNGFTAYRFLLLDEPLVLMERFEAARAVELIERYRVGTFIAVPTMLQRIARLDGVTERDFSSVMAVQQGGASMPEWLTRFWLDLVGAERFFMSYGSTERVGLAIVRGDAWLEHPGTVGLGHNGTEIKILDPEGVELPPGEVGEIFMRQPSAAGPSFEYVGASAPPKTPDGYTSIGDLGWLDDDGYLYIADRRVDLIITGGSNVYPAEVEAALTEHPGVADVVVIGLPDQEWGHRVHAVVQPATGIALTPDELDAHCRVRLSPYKRPKSFELVERLPRTDAGKINRTRMVDERT